MYRSCHVATNFQAKRRFLRVGKDRCRCKAAGRPPAILAMMERVLFPTGALPTPATLVILVSIAQVDLVHPMTRKRSITICAACFLASALCFATRTYAEKQSAQTEAQRSDFFESRIRPLLVQHCYECHSEESGEQQGGLLLDRESGWIDGGEMGKAVLPGEIDGSLLITAIRYDHDDLQMPPDGPLDPELVQVFEKWIAMGAPGPAEDIGESEFSRLGDQEYIFRKAESHWSYQPIVRHQPPRARNERWNDSPIDQFVDARLAKEGLNPSRPATPSAIARRIYYALTGLPPTFDQVRWFVDIYQEDSNAAIRHLVQRLIDSPAYGEHMGRMWLDVARYADTDSAYRPDTRSPYYFPFAFTYRDYVIDSLNADKPFDVFVREQLAADLMGYENDDPEIAALGFLSTGPYVQRSPQEAIDDWIDVTSRGLMGITAACARCHDHKFEPVPTADYYSLRGVFASMQRTEPYDEKTQPLVSSYIPTPSEVADYEAERAAIDKKIADAAGKTSKNNRRTISGRIRDTELAELLTFHPGAPAHAMVVRDLPKPQTSFVFVRGDARSRGEEVPRRFLKLLDPAQEAFSDRSSGRLELANKIVSPDNPLTPRVIVNRVWGFLVGSYLVETPSDFGLQGSAPTHPELLDWMTEDFVSHGWSIKRLVRQIVSSQAFLQSSRIRDEAAKVDIENRYLWRANRKHHTIEMLRDSVLSVSDQLNRTPRGRSGLLWGDDYTRRRAVYGFINRFNLDPTLRAFDFPTPMQTQSMRGESIVAQQALFTLNSDFVADQSRAITERDSFLAIKDDKERIGYLFRKVYQREPADAEVTRVAKFIEYQSRFKVPEGRPSRFINSPWSLIAQSLMMSNEFQYID